ncbi:hypothetical protein BU15DRAFT_62083 [Melanogaster broomeanus]|nr:hypothetical protein BU15DRAFT_62083 [Melanogaster broomeanus]
MKQTIKHLEYSVTERYACAIEFSFHHRSPVYLPHIILPPYTTGCSSPAAYEPNVIQPPAEFSSPHGHLALRVHEAILPDVHFEELISSDVLAKAWKASLDKKRDLIISLAEVQSDIEHYEGDISALLGERKTTIYQDAYYYREDFVDEFTAAGKFMKEMSQITLRTRSGLFTVAILVDYLSMLPPWAGVDYTASTPPQDRIARNLKRKPPSTIPKLHTTIARVAECRLKVLGLRLRGSLKSLKLPELEGTREGRSVVEVIAHDGNQGWRCVLEKDDWGECAVWASESSPAKLLYRKNASAVSGSQCHIIPEGGWSARDATRRLTNSLWSEPPRLAVGTTINGHGYGFCTGYQIRTVPIPAVTIPVPLA